MRPLSSRVRIAALLAGSLWLAVPAWSRSDPAKPGEQKGDKEKPRLNLMVDRSVGFTPVTALFTGHLTGVDLHDPNFCHAAVTWIRIAPGQSEEQGYRIKEDPVCLHPKEEVSVATSFTKSFTLVQPGSYLVRLIVEGKDGTRVESAYTRVQVLTNQ